MDQLSKIFEFCSDYTGAFHAKARGDAKSPIKFVPDVSSDVEYDWNHVNELVMISEQVYNMQAFPTTPLFNLTNQKAKLELDKGKVREAALSILQYQGSALRHQAIKQYNKRMAQRTDDDEDSLDELERRILNFRSSDADLFNMIRNDLPDEWRVVQLTVDAPHARFKSTPKDDPITEQNFGLMMVTVQCGSVVDPEETLNLIKVPAVESPDNMPTIMKELYDILMLHSRLYKTDQMMGKDRHAEVRDELDNRMTSLINTIENTWLGFAKCLMLGRPIEKIREKVLNDIVKSIEKKMFLGDEDFIKSGRRQVLSRIIDGAPHLSLDQLAKGLLYVLDDDEERLPQLMDEVQTQRTKLALLQLDNVKRHPVIFILDNNIQSLPFESLGCLQTPTNPQPVSRIPSMAFLCALASKHRRNSTSVANTGVREDKIFYILNPDKNLEKTQKRLEGQFHEMQLGDGIVGEHPSLPEMKRVLSEMDAFMYCGHGSNLKNMPAQEIEKLNVRALPLLFGCNSGRLSRLGRTLDPTGIACYYLIASAPCMLGFLWSVTDRDIDKWTVSFLQHWLCKGDGPHESQFIRAVANQKGKFKRKINSAATVVYGLPLISQM